MTRTGTHIRGNRVLGDPSRLNEKGKKVLNILFYSPISLTKEEIMQKTSFNGEDVERQVKLLLGFNLLHNNSRFPRFPQRGWRVNTQSTKHAEIIEILGQEYLDEATMRTKNELGGYLPKGMDLEGTGIQTNNGRSYPNAVLVDELLEYRPETLKVVSKWKKDIKPYRPKEYSEANVQERLKKFIWLSDRLAKIYEIEKPKVVIGGMNEDSWNQDGSSGSSSYRPSTHTITINGKFSVVTFIHEFGHARGFDEVDTILWSTNLFKRIYPVLFSRIENGTDSHLIIPNREETSFRF